MLRLAEDCDPTALDLTPAQGYLFSRIDGRTQWRHLREMGGLAPSEVDACLSTWLERGLIEVDAKQSTARGDATARALNGSSAAARPGTAKRSAKATTTAPVQSGSEAEPGDKPEIDESRIDASLDLDEDTQRRILEFEAGLDRNYYQLLGIPRDADGRAIKKAYFRLSKEFHPDRYFRRNIGGYAPSLDRIFKKVLEAHELLSDPTTRTEIDKSIGPEFKPRAASAEPAGSKQQSTPPRQRPLTPIERLKQRMPFKISPERIAERKAKAAEFHQSAQVSARGGKFLEAASSARLAIAFDPYNADYKRSFAEIQAKAAQKRVDEMLARDDRSLDADEQIEALRLYEDTLLYKPHDPVINDRAAQLALSLGDLDKAMEYAQRAVEHSPEEGSFHRTLGRVHHKQGDRGHAVRELEIAVSRNPKDHEARKLLDALTRRLRRKASDRGAQ